MRCALALLVLAACDAQVDPSYAGEPILRLHGTSIGFASGDLADRAAARWNTQRGSDLTAGPTTELPLQPVSSSELWVLLLAEPPDDAYFHFGDLGDGSARIAEATLLLTRGDEPVASAVDVALVHVDGLVEPGSLAAKYLGGTAAPGFRLRRIRPTAGLSEAQAYFAALCGGGDACRAPRLYALAPIAEDTAANIAFYRSAR
jgi:hypothetical protein